MLVEVVYYTSRGKKNVRFSFFAFLLFFFFLTNFSTIFVVHFWSSKGIVFVTLKRQTVSRWAILSVLFLTGYLNKFLKMLGFNLIESSKRLQSTEGRGGLHVASDTADETDFSLPFDFHFFYFPFLSPPPPIFFPYFPQRWKIKRSERAIRRRTCVRRPTDIPSVDCNWTFVRQTAFLSDGQVHLSKVFFFSFFGVKATLTQECTFLDLGKNVHNVKVT